MSNDSNNELAEPNEAERVNVPQSNSDSPEASEVQPAPTKTKRPLSRKRTKIIAISGACGLALIALVVALVLVFSGPKMPDLIGKKPYVAKVELANTIDSDQIEFQTQDEIFADPETEADYVEWVVVDQSVKPGSSIHDEVVTITIQPTDEYMARRERIIEEFIDNQEKVYGWKEGEITYTDLGDVLVVSFKYSNDENYYPIGYQYDEKGGQVETDQLASALGSDVIELGYYGDWLSGITVGLYSQSPVSAQEKTYALTKKILEDGFEFAKANRKTALEHLKKVEQDYHDASVSYEVTDEGAYIIKIQCNKRNYTWTEGKAHDENRQFVADSAARYLCAPVSVGYINGNGSLYKHFEANPTSYLWDKDTGDYMK